MRAHANLSFGIWFHHVTNYPLFFITQLGNSLVPDILQLWGSTDNWDVAKRQKPRSKIKKYKKWRQFIGWQNLLQWCEHCISALIFHPVPWIFFIFYFSVRFPPFVELCGHCSNTMGERRRHLLDRGEWQLTLHLASRQLLIVIHNGVLVLITSPNRRQLFKCNFTLHCSCSY